MATVSLPRYIPRWGHTNLLRVASDPPDWPFHEHPAADITIINLGTNDKNTANNISSAQFIASYIQLINEIHTRWPKSQIIVLSLWEGFSTPLPSSPFPLSLIHI